MIKSETTERNFVLLLSNLCSGLPLLAFLLFLVMGLPALHPTYADVAVIESWLRAMPHELPLLGVYSRLGWFHPGPALYYVLWPLYRLFGSSTDALHLAAWCHNAMFVALTLFYQRRYNASASPSFGIVLTALIVFWGPTVLSLPWNPYLAVMPLVCFLVMFAVFFETPTRALAPLVLVGSYLIQLHVSYLPIVGVAWVVAVGRRIERKVPLRWTSGSALLCAVVFAMWLPPAIALMRGVRGNFLDMVFALSKSSADHSGSLREALALLGEFPSWVLGLQSSPYPVQAHIAPQLTGPSALGVGILGALCSATLSRRSRFLCLYGVAVASLLWAVFSVLLVTGPALRYLFVWVPVVPGLFLWFELDALLRFLAHRAPNLHAVAQLGLAVTCLAAVARTVGPEVALSRDDPNAARTKTVSDCAEHAARVANQRWIHIIPEGAEWNSLIVSVRNELSKRGFRATTEWSFQALPSSDKGITPGCSYLVIRKGESTSGDSLLCRLGQMSLLLRRAPMVEFGKGWGPWEPGEFRWAWRQNAEVIVHHKSSAVFSFEVASSEFMKPPQKISVVLEDSLLAELKVPVGPWKWSRTSILLGAGETTEETRMHFLSKRKWRESRGTRVMAFPMRNAMVSTVK